MKETIQPLLKEDRKLPFLGMAWSCSKMAEFFNRHVLPALCPTREVAALTIQDMTYFAGRECEILYSLRLGNRAEDKPAWVVVTFTKDDRAEKIYTRHYQAPTPGQAMFLPSYRCLVEWFPSDWNLPSLPRATDDAAIGLLPAQASSHSQTPSDRRPHVEVLRYRPHLRCVIRYVPRSREEPVIGKVYPPGSKAAQAWNALCTLHAQAMVGITIPEPLALVEGWNLVLMECAAGSSMKQVLEGATTRGEAAAVVQLAARTLVWLHSLRIESQEVWSLETELEHVRHLNTRVRLVAPELADSVDGLLDRIVPLAPAPGAGTCACIHGDCKPSQFLVDGSRVALVDFDRACLGDVAVDVGNFMAALRKEVVRGREYGRELASHFRSEYERCSGRSGLVDRARVFESAALVRMAVRAFKRSPKRYAHKGGDSLPVLLLREAAECLANP